MPEGCEVGADYPDPDTGETNSTPLLVDLVTYESCQEVGYAA